MIVTFACAKGQSIWQLHLYELHVGRATTPIAPLFSLCGSCFTNIHSTPSLFQNPLLSLGPCICSYFVY